MTNTAPRPTARQQLADLAAEHGWTETVGGETTLRVQRGRVTVTATFKRSGSLHWAERKVDGRRVAEVWVTDSGKRETVAGWLTEADEQAPAQAAPVEPVGIPTVDEVADALAAGTWAPQHRVGGANPDVTDEDDVPAGAYATLDEAEAGQPRASVERLRELATRYDHHADALAADRARIVLARLDELEAGRDRAAAQADRFAAQLGTLRARLVSALTGRADGPIPTDDQLVRDVVDLRADWDMLSGTVRVEPTERTP